MRAQAQGNTCTLRPSVGHYQGMRRALLKEGKRMNESRAEAGHGTRHGMQCSETRGEKVRDDTEEFGIKEKQRECKGS
jgi:hypothetical protein